MCGRFSLAVAPERLQQHFPIERGAVGALQPRDNIAPSQPVLAVVAGSLQRQAVHFRWGLIPRWSQAPQAGWINARAETVAENHHLQLRLGQLLGQPGRPFRQRRPRHLILDLRHLSF